MPDWLDDARCGSFQQITQNYKEMEKQDVSGSDFRFQLRNPYYRNTVLCSLSLYIPILGIRPYSIFLY